MKYAAAGCALALSGWLALGLAISGWLQLQGVEWTQTLFVSIPGGLAAWIGVGLVYSSLKLFRQCKAIQSGIAASNLKDGAEVVIAGTISPSGASTDIFGGPGLLVAPLNGALCVAYTYKITEVKNWGQRRSVITHARGCALIPATITTQAGSFKLLTVPELESEAVISSSSRIRDAAGFAYLAAFQQYAKTTAFIQADQSTKNAANELVDSWTDADGHYRSDVAYSDLSSIDWSNCKLEQQQILAGRQVCVFGTYSADKAGIVPSPPRRGSPRLVEGSSEAVVAKLRSRARFWLFFGSLFVGGVSAALGLISAKLVV